MRVPSIVVIAALLLALAAPTLAAKAKTKAAQEPTIAVTSTLALLQRSCTKPSVGFATLNQTDCVKCMARVARTTSTESLLGCHSICQSRSIFKHFNSSSYAPAQACSKCMSAPGVPAAHCKMCLTKFGQDPAALETCMTCMQSNKHVLVASNTTLKRYADSCIACTSLKSHDDAASCIGCLSLGRTDPASCAAQAMVRNPTLMLNFSGAPGVDAQAVMHAVHALINGSGVTRLATTNSSTVVTLQYQFSTQQLLDASAVAIKTHLQGLLPPFFPAVASACRNCTIFISGLFHTATGGAHGGIRIGCKLSYDEGDWETVIVPRLCNYTSTNTSQPIPSGNATSSGRRLLTQMYYWDNYVETDWQYPSFVTTANDGAADSGPITGCGDANGADQNLIQQICMWGGWYVNALSVTFESGFSQQWGVPAGNLQQCMSLAVSEGEVITGVYAQIGDWMNGLAFTTSMGQTLQAGCSDDGGNNGCPGNSDYSQWGYNATLAAPAKISQALVNMNNGMSTASALSTALSQTTSSGYLCGIYVTSGDYINQISLYFMLPITTMTASSTLNLVSSSTSTTATSQASINFAAALCPKPGESVGSISVSSSTEYSTKLSVGQSFSTEYSTTDTSGWSLSATVGYSAGPVGFSGSVTAGYSSSTATSSSTGSGSSSSTDVTTSGGDTSSQTFQLACPARVPPNALCNWTYLGYSTVSWTPTAWDIPATYNLLAGTSWTTTLSGTTTQGTKSVKQMALTSLRCEGVEYVTQSPAADGR